MKQEPANAVSPMQREMRGKAGPCTERIHSATNPRPVCLVRVPRGVVAGTTVHLQGNTTVQSWTLLCSREQFQAWSSADPRRFDDPLQFAHLVREFDRVFDRPDVPDPRTVARNR